MKTAAVVSYCSYQKRYIDRLIKELRKFVAGEIVVVSCTHFFDGRKEVPFKGSGEIDIRFKYEKGHPSRYYHNLQRKMGYDILQGEYDAVYFLDGDEVPIGDKMKEWQNLAEVGNYRFASYWYFRDTCNQAKVWVDSAALVSTESLNEANWFAHDERESYAKFETWRRLTTFQDKPMIHHYGWAGTKELLLRKVQSWGHNEDMDWVKEVNEEFDDAFDGTCFFKENDRYLTVTPFIGFKYGE